MAIRQYGLFGAGVSWCEECGRQLTNPVSVALGIGPICRGSHGAGGDGQPEDDIADQYNPDVKLTDRVVLSRDPETGRVSTNVPHFHRHHSPTGYEFGYGGSGPSDLALNLAVFLCDYLGVRSRETVRMWDSSQCPAVAYAIHQELKWEFVAGAERDGAEIAWSRIVEWGAGWLEDHRSELASIMISETEGEDVICHE